MWYFTFLNQVLNVFAQNLNIVRGSFPFRQQLFTEGRRRFKGFAKALVNGFSQHVPQGDSISRAAACRRNGQFEIALPQQGWKLPVTRRRI